jgi:predicted transcriptional regulator
VAREQMGKRAIQTLLTTFYDNSMERVVAAMIDREEVAPDELDRLAALIAKARKEGR